MAKAAGLEKVLPAVAGVFLRVLEYFNGLLFQTPNRRDDIDEATVSRGIAKYHPPDWDARAKIWHLMMEHFELHGPLPLIPSLTVSGGQRPRHQRARKARGKVPPANVSPAIEISKRCAVFRAMDSAGTSWPKRAPDRLACTNAKCPRPAIFSGLFAR